MNPLAALVTDVYCLPPGRPTLTPVAPDSRHTAGKRTMPFTFGTSQTSGEYRVRLEGEFDLAAFDDVDRELQRLQAQGCDRIVMDLQGVTFMDSSGIRALLRARKRSQDGGPDFLLAHPPEAVRNLLRLTTLSEHFEFAEDSEPSD
jgi:anti-anti-sigma factor